MKKLFVMGLVLMMSVAAKAQQNEVDAELAQISQAQAQQQAPAQPQAQAPVRKRGLQPSAQTKFVADDQGMYAATAQPATPPSNQPTYAPSARASSAPMDARMSTRYTLVPEKRTGITLIPTVQMAMSSTEYNDNSTLYSGQNTTNGSQTSFGGGLMAEFGRGMFTAETGLLYMTEGVKATFNNVPGYGGFAYNTNNTIQVNGQATYLGIPLLAKANFDMPRRSRFSVVGGFVPAMAMSYNETDTSQTINSFNGTANNQNLSNANGGMSDVRGFNVFGQVGIAGDMTIMNHQDIRVELDYRRPLMSLLSDNYTIYNVQQSVAVFSDDFMLSIGYGFDI